MNDKLLLKIFGKFVRQSLVMGNWMMNRVLKQHPQLADSPEIVELRTRIRELTDMEKELSSDD